MSLFFCFYNSNLYDIIISNISLNGVWNLRILGIDPGLATIGYALVDKKTNHFEVLEYGVIKTSADKEDIERLEIIHRNIEALIKEFKPEQMAVEELFFNKNVKTAIAVGQARGVILLAGSQAGIKVAEYTPLQIKQAVVGYGRADKKQVQLMVKSLLNLSEIPKPDDAADALAISICHGHVYSAHSGWEERL
ncbi:Holliday junction endonuclease RuvC [Halanaerobium congolense]|uniref:Crossover junction endodeoxyribonuclease RuvC n=1 Tax=Halanaerobium congolense TaxID=54121 RepID=A0A1G6PJ90_9FIRM|nr:MAG: crossover junction endodeoxyribonuclease RuvC [Halanaerobium sp. T82-1]PTX16805.1 Holliday junction endonuclease RuvC [Halanaerobium congolense]PUU92726.1 MAG: crossover junction endodeoxyribonuclease RuvC [Halanaerobium sp.]PXV66388.1 Holliday junction endonuclease RuvC [Halanaerobium congolense]TDP15655.1 Holliday junction endonuclease RuvC [Halanaerobium congolense]